MQDKNTQLCHWYDLTFSDHGELVDSNALELNDKIKKFSPDIDVREQALNKFKPFIPSNFHVSKPQARPSLQNILLEKRSNDQNIKIIRPNVTSKDSISVNDIIKKAEECSRKATSVAELIDIVYDFETNTKLQNLASKTIFFSGDHNAEIIVIGDIPDRNDETSGKPFSNISADIIKKSLKHLGYKINAFTNLIFWRPVTGEVPNEYYKIGLPFITKLIDLIKPRKIILAGGNVAYNMLNIEGSLISIRGTKHNFNLDGQGYECLVSLHPMKLQTGASKKIFWKDLLGFL